MTHFTLGQRVSIRACASVDLFEIVAFGANAPRSGVVVQLFNDGAWVELDRRDVLDVHPFPAGDQYGKRILTFHEFCDPTDAKGGAA